MAVTKVVLLALATIWSERRQWLAITASLARAKMDRARNEVFERPPGLTPVFVMLLRRAVREIVVAVGVVGAH